MWGRGPIVKVISVADDRAVGGAVQMSLPVLTFAAPVAAVGHGSQGASSAIFDLPVSVAGQWGQTVPHANGQVPLHMRWPDDVAAGLRDLPKVLVAALYVCALVDCIRTPPARIRMLPKVSWLVILVLCPVLGAIGW